MATQQALKAVADLTAINLREAAHTTRRHPLFDEEIRLEEELINLEEAIDLYHAAAPSIEKYPKIRRHLLRERRAILQHCMGLIIRKIYSRRERTSLDEKNQSEADEATKKLVQLIVTDAMRIGYEIDKQKLDVFRPYLGWRQRLATREGTNQAHGVHSLFRRLAET